MHGGARTGSITYSARTVGGGAGSRVPAAQQRPPHMFPQRKIGPCTRYRSAPLPPVATARRTMRRVTWRATVNHEDQAQGTAGAARPQRRGTAARRTRAMASAYPVPAARGDASGQRRRAGLPAASPQGRLLFSAQIGRRSARQRVDSLGCRGVKRRRLTTGGHGFSWRGGIVGGLGIGFSVQPRPLRLAPPVF